MTAIATAQAHLVPDQKRQQFLPRHFGNRLMILGEFTVYAWMERLCPEYQGGLWQFFETPNKGFYMAPKTDKPVHLRIDTNGFYDAMSAQAAGIVVCLFALCEMSTPDHRISSKEAQRFAEYYYRLRDFAAEHEEARLILQAID